MGRPLDKDERAALKKRLMAEIPKHYGFILQSAAACGVNVKTARRMVEDDEELQEAVAVARQNTQEQFGHLVAAVGLGAQTIPTTQVTPMIYASKVIGGLSEQTRVEHGGRVEWSPPPGAVKTESEAPDAGDGPPLLSLLKTTNGTS
jgi:hypothetical protein